MKLPRRTYYYKPRKKPSEQALMDRIEQICLDFPKYGYRRVTKQLHREGMRINHKKVHRIMREKGWLCRPRKKKWICTTDSNHKLPVYPNLIKDLTVDGINQLWVADITYIHLLACFVYLAVILDVFSRKAIGYAISRNLDTQLTLTALRMAIENRNPPPGCIHHSDRGVQYASKDYVKELKFYQFQISMSRRGNPFDNAYAESFIKTLKCIFGDIAPWKTLKDGFLILLKTSTITSGFIRNWLLSSE
jgi:putative transposase